MAKLIHDQSMAKKKISEFAGHAKKLAGYKERISLKGITEDQKKQYLSLFDMSYDKAVQCIAEIGISAVDTDDTRKGLESVLGVTHVRVNNLIEEIGRLGQSNLKSAIQCYVKAYAAIDALEERLDKSFVVEKSTALAEFYVPILIKTLDSNYTPNNKAVVMSRINSFRKKGVDVKPYINTIIGIIRKHVDYNHKENPAQKSET